MGIRNAKARMITGQEAISTGCLASRDGATYPTPIQGQTSPYNYGSCPDWMHNYLYNSTTQGGSYNDNTQQSGSYDYGYWTMNAISDYQNRAWIVPNSGALGHNVTNSTSFSARAVVEINK